MLDIKYGMKREIVSVAGLYPEPFQTGRGCGGPAGAVISITPRAPTE